MNARWGTLSFAAIAIVSLMGSVMAVAQTFPTKVVRIVIPFPPGGSGEAQARILGKYLNQDWNQPVIVESRPGGGTTIGAGYVAKSAPDGYTLYLAGTSFSILPSVYKNLTFDPVKNFSPVSLLAVSPFILAVHPSVNASTVNELIGLARSQPGKLNYASTGSGVGPHLSAQMLKAITGIQVTHVPYSGTGPALIALLAGQVEFSFVDAAAIPHFKSGKLRPLAVSTAKRYTTLPELPTIAEQGIRGFDTSNWSMILGPSGLPKEIVRSINSSIRKTLEVPEVRQLFASQGYETTGSTPEEASALLVSEISKYAELVRISGARVE